MVAPVHWVWCMSVARHLVVRLFFFRIRESVLRYCIEAYEIILSARPRSSGLLSKAFEVPQWERKSEMTVRPVCHRFLENAKWRVEMFAKCSVTLREQL